MSIEDEELSEEELLEAYNNTDEDEELWQDSAQDEFSFVRPEFDENGDPLPPTPLGEDGQFLSRNRMRRQEELDRMKGKIQTTVEPQHIETIVEAFPQMKMAPINGNSPLFSTLKKEEQSFSVDVSISIPDLSLLKMLKKGSDLSDNEFIEFIGGEINPMAIAKAIWDRERE